MIKCNNGGCVKDKDICCQSCDEIKICKGACIDKPSTDDSGCGEAVFESNDPVAVFQSSAATVINDIAEIFKAKADLDEKEKSLKAQLKEAMERNGVKSFSNDVLKITYVAATIAASLDSKALKSKYPAIAAECTKTSPKSSYVKVELVK
jgi:hypothetical protein